jgi:hypothetical protein
MLRCQVCGRRLSVKELVTSLTTRPYRTYPRSAPDGERREYPVHWLCGSCVRRGQRRRQEGKAKGVTAAIEEGPPTQD